jgi:hypothetical protein
MTHNNKIAFLILAAVVAWAAAVPACAQITTAPVVQAKPLRTAVAKPTSARFEVLHMMSTSIQVRSLANQREVHTFVYSDQIRGQMQKLFYRGGYRYGDRIKIRYHPGTEVALKIIGKPSKPL